MSEFSEKMGMAAGNNFKSGYNCCEAIVETFRKEAGVNIDDNAFRLCSGFGGGIGHEHCLGGGGGAVVHRGVGDCHAGELSHHRLEFEDVVQSALRNLGLVGGVRGEEFRAFNDAWNYSRGVVVVDTGTGKAGELLVVACQTGEQLAYLELAFCLGQVVFLAETYALGHVAEQLVERGYTNTRQHRLDVGLGVWEILICHIAIGIVV